MCAALALTVVRPPPTPGPFARDFEAYYAAGATWNAGGDPWSRDVWRVERTIPGVDASRDELLPFVGPPAAIPLWSLLARLPFTAARVVWLTMLALAFAVLVLAATALAGRAASPFHAALAALLVALSGPGISALLLGQVALLAAAGLAVAFAASGARAGAGAFVAALQPNLALPLVVRLLDRRAAVALVVAGVAFGAITLLIAHGTGGVGAYAKRLGAHGEYERFIAIQYTVAAVVAGVGLPRAAAQLAGAAATFGAVVTVALAALRRNGACALGWLAVAVLPLAEPFFHEHDFVIEALPAIGLAAAGDPRVRLVAGVGTVAAFVDWFGLAQRPPALTQIAVLAVAVGCTYAVLAYRQGDALVTTLAPVAAAVVLVAVCVPLAATHPAPTWPDQLGDYHAPAAADVSAVWGAEQRRSGLEQIDPVWAFLRAIPLAGCVLLAYGALRVSAAAREAPREPPPVARAARSGRTRQAPS